MTLRDKIDAAQQSIASALRDHTESIHTNDETRIIESLARSLLMLQKFGRRLPDEPVVGGVIHDENGWPIGSIGRMVSDAAELRGLGTVGQ